MKRMIFRSMLKHGMWMALCLFAVLPVAAQPWAKKASKAVFTLKTFTADGTLLGSAAGFYTDEQGTAISSFAPFRGAERAVVIDAQGKELPVSCMLGASETYDVAKFRVEAKKTAALPMAAAAATEGSTVWLLPYRADGKAGVAASGSIRKAETFNEEYVYYTVAMAVPDEAVGSPLMNEQGEVVGVMQQPYKQGDSLNYAVGIQYADSLRITGLSINDPVLKSTAVKKALPDDLEQALLTLYVAGASLDSVAYQTLISDFISKFPNAPDGYIYRAQWQTNSHQFAEAARNMEQAIKVADKKDEAHFNYAKLIYQQAIYMADDPYEPWSLDKALEEAREADRINPQPVYRHQQAVTLYAQKKYDEAYDVYTTLFNSDLRSAEIFFEASRCKLMQRDTTAVLALLDSCVAQYGRPYLKEAAPYIFVRAQARLDAQKYRDAVADLNDYENLMGSGLNADFYYMRYQADLGGRLFQQALNDINKAIEVQPDSEVYLAEKASLQVRVGQFDEAAETARECIKLAPDSSDGYLFLGLAQCLKGQKAEGVVNLRKARELGDTQADDLIERYSK